MLKLHHMNLLNEIQETTLMMNLYQQQQLQQQQLQQQASVEALSSADAQMNSLLNQKNQGTAGLNGFDMLGNQPQRSSLGLDSFAPPPMLMQQQPVMSSNPGGVNGATSFGSPPTPTPGSKSTTPKKTKEPTVASPTSVKPEKKRSPKTGTSKSPKRQKAEDGVATTNPAGQAQI
jgi:hypothetical protein